ncbi:MAG TPA: OmpA family protein [Thermoanaerobaculia bacterium]|jgi:outer membrane protein OmpA-like peptidoglycan-associated protein|nr:OmpA family protein [Thermoanaerobaculia bacterium]
MLSLAVAVPGMAQQQTPKQALAQGQLNGLIEAQNALTAADQAGAQQYAKSLYDDAHWRLSFAQNNWNAAKGSMREQAKLRAEEALWAARAALAKARWLGTNAALRGLQNDVVRLGGPSSSMMLVDEPPMVDISRGTNSRERIKYAQAIIDQAKAAGAEMVEGNDLKPAQDNLATARKLTRNDSQVESADHLAFDSEMMARRAMYLVRLNESSKYMPDLQMTRTRLAQAEADRLAQQERQQRQMAEQRATELQRQLLDEQANRQAQSAELDKLRQQVDESRRQLDQQLEADKVARSAAEQALDAAFSKYESAVTAGTSSDVEALRRQLEDQQLSLRGIQQREMLNEQQMAAEIAGLQTSLQNAQQQGTMNAQVLSERQAELTRRQQELEQLRQERQADITRRAELDRQRDQVINEAMQRRAEAEAQAQALKQQIEQANATAQQAQQQAQMSASALQSANEELERTRQQLAQRDSDVRRVQMESELAKFGNTRNDNGRFIVALSGGLLFDTGKSTLKPGAKATLSKIAAQLQSDDSIRISVEGHTDSVGSEDLNQSLSEKRAAAVRDFLVNAGVPESRISSDGQGEAQPIATNKTAAGRQQNRRVELVITH